MKRQRSQSKSNKSLVPKNQSSKSVCLEQPKVKKKKDCKPKSTKHTTMSLLDFPDELLVKFQSYLPYHSKCQCVETCTRLNQVYSDPSIWAGMHVNRCKIKKEGIEELKTVSRFSKIKHINIGNQFLEPSKLENVLQYACWRNKRGNSLESIDLYKNNFVKISAKLLKEAICSIEDVNLKESILTAAQQNALFNFIPSRSTLKRLNLKQNNLINVSPKKLKEGICCIEDVNIYGTGLTTIQLDALFSLIPTRNTLKKINLGANNLKEVSPELLKKAICHLEDVNLLYNLPSEHRVYLWYNELTTIQLNVLFSFIPTQNILKQLNLSYNHLEEVCPELLKKAVCHLKDVDLCNTSLTTTQLNSLLSFIPTQNILKRINLKANNLKEVSSELLNEAIGHCEDANLTNIQLTTPQLNALLSFIPTSHNLKRINLSYNLLEEVCPELLKKAVCHFEEFDLSRTSLTTKHLDALFSFIPAQNKLKRINFSDNDLSKTSPELLKKAVCHLEDVNLSDTELTIKQLNDLFSIIPTQHTLKKIDLCGNESMYKVDRKLLTNAVDHLSYVRLIKFKDLWYFRWKCTEEEKKFLTESEKK